MADVLAGKDGRMPPLVHVHPTETVRDAIDYMREYGVSQLPVLKAEPPVVTGEIAGSIAEKDLLDALFTGQAHLHDTVERHMGAPLPMIGGGQPVERGGRAAGERRRGHGADRRQAGRRPHPPGPAGPPRPNVSPLILELWLPLCGACPLLRQPQLQDRGTS